VRTLLAVTNGSVTSGVSGADAVKDFCIGWWGCLSVQAESRGKSRAKKLKLIKKINGFTNELLERET